MIAHARGDLTSDGVIMMLMLAIGILCYVFLLGRIEPIPEPAAEVGEGTTTAAA